MGKMTIWCSECWKFSSPKDGRCEHCGSKSVVGVGVDELVRTANEGYYWKINFRG